MAMNERLFRVELSGDFYLADGAPRYPDAKFDALAPSAGIELGRFAEHQGEVQPDQLTGANGFVALTPRVTARSLGGADDLLAIGRFGVGYDTVDVAACTAADVLLYITTGAVDYSVAEATVGWMLALAHQSRIKDQLVRDARWDDRNRYMGSELRERTLGVVGFGGIGRTLLKLLSGFRMRTPLVFDPFVSPEIVDACGAKSVSLDELLASSDFVSLHCPLNDATRNLIGPRELSLMKPTSWLINTARGGIIDEEALFAALSDRRIAGAAIDCFVGEPLLTPPRLAGLDNVLLAPHSIAWTAELFRDISRAACQGMLDLVHGKRPASVVNPQVFERDGFRAKWERLCPAKPNRAVTSPLPASLSESLASS
jgi:phosphoglycerate dehydrogenase-like enzyme